MTAATKCTGNNVIKQLPKDVGTFEQYTIKKVIGESNHTVKLATKDDKNYAVKIITLLTSDKDAILRTERELNVMCHLQKQNQGFVKIYDLFKEEFGANTTYYIFMELAEGNLSDYVDKMMDMPSQDDFVSRIKRIMMALCDLVNNLHVAGVIHGDLKPENILYFRHFTDGAVKTDLKLVDFGISCIVPNPSEESAQCDHNGGTDGYIDPLIYRGSNITKASDVYSLGVIFFRLLNSRKYFAGYGGNTEQVLETFMLNYQAVKETNPIFRLHNITFNMLRPYNGRVKLAEVKKWLTNNEKEGTIPIPTTVKQEAPPIKLQQLPNQQHVSNSGPKEVDLRMRILKAVEEAINDHLDLGGNLKSLTTIKVIEDVEMILQNIGTDILNNKSIQDAIHNKLVDSSQGGARRKPKRPTAKPKQKSASKLKTKTSTK